MHSRTNTLKHAHHSQQLVPFVGREAEVANIMRMLNDSACRLVTLIGPGGIGKTRLALRTADLAVDRFADGCIWRTCKRWNPMTTC